MTVGLLSFGYTSFPFMGNPNVLATGTPAGSIVTSRDSDGSTYQTPFFIQASASGITCSGTSVPYEDMSYYWNFGDPSGTETIVRPTDGVTINANNQQTGPEAAYVYRTGGVTYTITLTVVARTAAGYTTTTFTKNVIVNAFATGANEMWFDQVGGSDSNNGLSIGAPKQTVGALNTAIVSGKWFHIKRQSNYTGTEGINFNLGSSNITGVRIDAYGSGANPIVNVSVNSIGQQTAPFRLNNIDIDIKDVVVSNIDLINSASVASGSLHIETTDSGNTTNVVKNIYWDSSIVTMTYDGNASGIAVANVGGNPDYLLCTNIGFWKTSFINPTNSTKISMGLLGSASSWNFVVGCYFEGAGSDSTYDHHFYPDHRYHSVCSLSGFGPTGTGTNRRSYSHNINWDAPRSSGITQDAQYHCTHQNLFGYTSFGYDLGNAQNNSDALDNLVQFSNVVVSENGFKGCGGTLMSCGLSITVRYNRWWDCLNRGDWYNPVGSGQAASVAQATHLLSKVYFNKLYVPSGAASGFVFQFPDSWTAKQVFTDNIIVDARTNGQIFQIVSSDWVSAGSVINRNQYWSAASDTTFLFDGVTAKTFGGGGSWQTLGWDANGSNTNPGWNGGSAPTQWNHMN